MAKTETSSQISSAAIIDTRKSPFAQLVPVPMNSVQLRDNFWAPRRETNWRVTLPAQFAMLEKTERLENMRRAATNSATFQSGLASDSDVYKWLEAASWQLASQSDEALLAQVELVVDEVEKMQKSDGYLHSFYEQNGTPPRYESLKMNHELYCFGHFMQAAVAHFRSTASTRMLDVAVKLANHVVKTFGNEANQRRETDGHQEIELGLIELYRVTRDEKYLCAAQFFIDLRGQGTLDRSPYFQDDATLRAMEKINGHAVRCVYFLAAATDAFAESGDETLRTALRRLWKNMTQQKMYISGGIGSRHEGEAFGHDYELPNARAYAETCAAIAVVMWAFRMLQVEPLCEYSDVMETALYNGVLGGLALGGDDYFYVNPLQSDGTQRRQKWYDTACCPPNLARLVAQLPGYFYSTNRADDSDSVWVHLYAAGDANIQLQSGARAKFSVETAYPFEGDVRFVLQSDAEFALHLRIPAWCEHAKIVVTSGAESVGEYSPPAGEYFEIVRAWKNGDCVELSLPMPPRAVKSHARVTENTARVAVMRGPLLYCAEQTDNENLALHDVFVGAKTLQTFGGAGVLRGISLLRGAAHIAPENEGDAPLYTTASTRDDESRREAEITLIPYYAWANREPGSMQVWLRDA